VEVEVVAAHPHYHNLVDPLPSFWTNLIVAINMIPSLAVGEEVMEAVVEEVEWGDLSTHPPTMKNTRYV